MAKKKREEKEEWIDDGRTIVPMSGDEIPSSSRGFFQGRERKKNLKNGGKSDITGKETRAMIRALFANMLPILLLILGSFALVGVLMYFWFR